jgi:hypothetical protein
MSDTGEIIRPILFVIRLFQWMAAVVVMGISAWSVVHLKDYRVIYTLVIVRLRCLSLLLRNLFLADSSQATLTVAFYIPALFLACMKRNRGYMLPVDIIFYAL